ncbi:GGDEF domain-containing protein [Mycolicibacterium frederiksbergense]|nr:GGDEF domain-containing protein [Mycolicibacterium frederiksbergense]
MRLFARIAAVGCFSLAVLVVMVQFHPAGPSGVVARGAQAAVLLSAVAVGARWRWWPWPSYRQAVIFAVWLDVSIAVLAVAMSTPVARLCVVMFMGLNGVFVAFLLGWRIQVMHLVFCCAVIAVIVTDAAFGARADLSTVFLVLAPTLTWVLVVSLCGSMLVEYGRKAARKTARSAHYDPLTGLRNRRGMYAAINNTLHRAAAPITVVAAVCDIDRFKQLNDRNGHAAGDAALVAMADQLSSLASRAELTARIGGDELVLVTFAAVDDADGVVGELFTRLGSLTRARTPVLPPTVSVGIAAHSTADPHFSVDDVLRHADAAMYDAKRSGGGACVVYRPGLTQPARHAATVHRFRSAGRD